MNQPGYNVSEVKRPRSVFNYKKRHTTTIAVGDLVPIDLIEILPGDSFSLDVGYSLVGASPFVSPVYGDFSLSLFAFFVPNRLVWTHWFQFCGQNDDGAWTQTHDYLIPKGSINAPALSQRGYCVGNYYGCVPLGGGSSFTPYFVNELPLRGYVRIWNEWFRNENTTDPILISYGDGGNGSIYAYSDLPLKVARFHDIFSNCLPAPQKGDAVTVPLAGKAPVTGSSPLFLDAYAPAEAGGVFASSFTNPAKLTTSGPANKDYNLYFHADSSSAEGVSVGNLLGLETTVSGSNHAVTGSNLGIRPSEFSKLQADLSKATSATINSLRLAFQTQVYFEMLSQFGSRYDESVYALFGVRTGDTRAYKTELLSKVTLPLAMQEVVATSSSADNSATEYALGQQVVKIKDNGSVSLMTSSFVEHGYVHILACVRTLKSYAQGIDRTFTKNRFLDLYNPVFDNIGETPVYVYELNALAENAFNHINNQGQVAFDNATAPVLGYNRAWSEYRYQVNRVSGALTPVPDNASFLPTFSFAEWFTDLPTLTGIMTEPRYNVQRTMALTTLKYDFIADFVISGSMARVMSVDSNPGLIDHHGV